MILDTGTVINNIYRVVKLLGKGAMGNVYLVEKIEDDSKFVVKELIFSPDTDAALTKKIFFRESEFMAKFDHPGLPEMYGIFSQNDRDYIVMEYIEGKTLEEIINASSEPMFPRRAMKFILELADILDYLHNSFHTPVVYRDLKPSNIIITPEGDLTLVDFGIARYYNPDKDTDTFSYGSPGYAAPEQYRGKGQTTPQTDIFGLGVILYQLITKYDPSLKPFVFPPIKSFNQSFPDELENLIRKAIEMDPVKRYISMKDFKEAMEKYRNNKKIPPSSSSSSKEEPLPLNESIIDIIKTCITGIPLVFIIFLPTLAISSSIGITVTKHPGEMLYYMICQIIFIILLGIFYTYKGGPARLCCHMDFVALNIIAIVLFNIIAAPYCLIQKHRYYNMCINNLNTMGTSLELYAQDNGGLYPPSLDKILVKSGKFTPLIKKIPLCYERHKIDNRLYSKIRSENKSPHYLYTVSGKFDNFTLCCNTPLIHGIYKNSNKDCWPQYSSQCGLLSGPDSKPVKLKNL